MHLEREHIASLIRTAVSAMLFITAFAVPQGIAKTVLFLAAYIIAGCTVLFEAVCNIFHGRVFDENFLMSTASVGAIILGAYPEAVAVMLFYQVGELFEKLALAKSRRSIAALMEIMPETASVVRFGEVFEVHPDEVSPDEEIFVRPGEKVPLDGIVIEGHSDLDTKALTGESISRSCAPGDEIFSGCVNLTGALRIRVSKPYEDSTAAKILELVENAASRKAKTENFITRFARIYTPAVVCSALLLAIIPPLLFAPDWDIWIMRALIFLVVSCPCALVISVPMTFFAGIGSASRRGILIKGSSFIEVLSRVDTVVFDKTGTLTSGKSGASASPDVLETAAYAEAQSTHPAASAIREAYGVEIDYSRLSDVQEFAGLGVSARLDGTEILCGSRRFLAFRGIEIPESVDGDVFTAKSGRYLGSITLRDELKSDACDISAALSRAGAVRTVMLTGDRESTAAEVAKAAGIGEYRANLLPCDKVAAVEALLSETKGTLAYAGDGINDAPVLARADVGISMGALGSDAAIEAADVVLMDDSLLKIATALRIAKKTMRIVKENIIFALGIKGAVLILAAFGLANMWLAVFADVGVAVLAILNAMRALKL